MPVLVCYNDNESETDYNYIDANAKQLIESTSDYRSAETVLQKYEDKGAYWAYLTGMRECILDMVAEKNKVIR